jgi:hypothetical protein
MVNLLFSLQCRPAMFCMFLLTVNFMVSTPLSLSTFYTREIPIIHEKYLLVRNEKCATSVFTCIVKKFIVLNRSSRNILITWMNVGTAYGSLENPKLTFNGNVKLWVGNNKISLLSVAVGLSVSCLFFHVFVICDIFIC